MSDKDPKAVNYPTPTNSNPIDVLSWDSYRRILLMAAVCEQSILQKDEGSQEYRQAERDRDSGIKLKDKKLCYDSQTGLIIKDLEI